MPAGQLHDARWGAAPLEKHRASLGMVQASLRRPPQLEPRRGRCEPLRASPRRRDHVQRPVDTTLGTFADVMQQGGGDEFRIVVPAGEQPAGRGGAVADVSRVLVQEQLVERRRQVCPRELEVIGGGSAASCEELPDAVAHGLQHEIEDA